LTTAAEEEAGEMPSNLGETMEENRPSERTTSSGFYYDDGDDEEVFVPKVEEVGMGEAYGRQLDREGSEPSRFQLARERTTATPFPSNRDFDDDEDDEDVDGVHYDDEEEQIFVPAVVEVGMGEAYGRQQDREGNDQPSTFQLARQRTAATPFHDPSSTPLDCDEDEDEEYDEAKVSVFEFESGLADCCTTNPDNYKVVAEMPNARLVEMTLAPGAEDQPHDHPAHSMYVIQGGKLAIRGPPEYAEGEAHEVEIPTGAAPIMPAGPHQVKNVGDTEVKIVFVEALPACKPCGDVEGFVKPFDVSPSCYQVLAENEEWITGIVTMEPGTTDELHHHRDHLIYVLEGDEVSIYPDGDMADPHAVPIKPNAGIPAPISAGPIFSKHLMKNSGSSTTKMVFFEMKT